jgi:hypothetical protein
MGSIYVTYYYKESTDEWQALAYYVVGAISITGLPVFVSDGEKVSGVEVVTLSDNSVAVAIPEKSYWSNSVDFGVEPYNTFVVLQDLAKKGIILKITSMNSETKCFVMTSLDSAQVQVNGQIWFKLSAELREIDNPKP